MFSGRSYFRVDGDIGQKRQDAQRGKRKSENQEKVLLGLSSSLYVNILVRVCGVVEAISGVSITPPAVPEGSVQYIYPAGCMRYEWFPLQEGSWQEG